MRRLFFIVRTRYPVRCNRTLPIGKAVLYGTNTRTRGDAPNHRNARKIQFSKTIFSHEMFVCVIFTHGKRFVFLDERLTFSFLGVKQRHVHGVRYSI